MQLTTFLPDTSSRYLRLCVVTVVFVFVSLAVYEMYTAFHRIVDFGSIYLGMFNIVLGAGLIYVSIYLWKLRVWARKSAKVIIALLVVVSIAGVFNPFFAMEYAHLHDQSGPEWLVLLGYIVPCVIVAVLCFWALDKYREHFH
jgi:hypothetical protein